jgi:ubiquitin-conjugating enzyme E2 D/E
MLAKTPLEFCPTITLVNDDIFNWECHIVGPEDSPYHGGVFLVLFEFPSQYPFKAPKLNFITKIYHPSVQTESGEICQDVVGQWGPTLNAKHCLEVIYTMLKSPETDHPLEEAIATQLREKPKEFDKMARKYTKEYAK